MGASPYRESAPVPAKPRPPAPKRVAAPKVDDELPTGAWEADHDPDQEIQPTPRWLQTTIIISALIFYGGLGWLVVMHTRHARAERPPVAPAVVDLSSAQRP